MGNIYDAKARPVPAQKGPILEAMDAYADLKIQNTDYLELINEKMQKIEKLKNELKDAREILRNHLMTYTSSFDEKVKFRLHFSSDEFLTKRDLQYLFGDNWPAMLAGMYEISEDDVMRYFE